MVTIEHIPSLWGDGECWLVTVQTEWGKYAQRFPFDPAVFGADLEQFMLDEARNYQAYVSQT